MCVYVCSVFTYWKAQACHSLTSKVEHWSPETRHSQVSPEHDVWEGWFSHLDGLTCVPDKLRQSARTASVPSAAQISPDLLELREWETRQIQEVSPEACIYHSFFFLIRFFRVSLHVAGNGETYTNDFSFNGNKNTYSWKQKSKTILIIVYTGDCIV